MKETWIAQSFILIGYLIFFASRFKNMKKGMLITDNISRICFATGYILFRSVNGIEHTAYGIVRNIVAQYISKKSRLQKWLYFAVMFALLMIMYGKSFAGIPTIMLWGSAVINLITAFFMQEQEIRLGTFLAAICNVVAFMMLSSYASVLGEGVCGVIGIVSYINGKRQDA